MVFRWSGGKGCSGKSGDVLAAEIQTCVVGLKKFDWGLRSTSAFLNRLRRDSFA